MTKSLRGLGNRDKEETRLEMEGLKEEIKHLKISEDKIMRTLQDLREEMKCSDRPPERDKPRFAEIREDWPDDEIRALVKNGLQTI